MSTLTRTLGPATARALATASLVVAIVAVSAVPAQAAPPRVPFGFVGSMIDGPMTEPGFPLDRETGLMARSGVESTRLAVQWIDAQPYRTPEEVPEADRARFQTIDGVPTTFETTDRLLRSAALRRMRVLPAVTTTPGWAAKAPGVAGSPPADTAPYASFMRALVQRYGPNGAFWRENPSLPRLPVRQWQLWNEPNLQASWNDSTWAPGYVKLLRAGSEAVRRADGGARIVLAGLANRSFADLAQIYRQPGSRGLFDTVAIHPYTVRPRGVIRILALARRTMRRFGDAAKPLAVTEYGWPSSRGKTELFGFETTERGQAQRLRRVLPLLARALRPLRLKATYHYTWVGRERPGAFTFQFSGLRRLSPSGTTVSKPALASFRRSALRLERCARKTSVATRCARRTR